MKISTGEFSKIGDTGIFLGPFPRSEADVQVIAKAGVTGVLCVQTEDDMEWFRVDWPKMQKLYASVGIKPVHFPITDFDDRDLSENLIAGANELNCMRQDGLTVYVHCTSGMHRSPAIVVTYLTQFCPDFNYGRSPPQTDNVSKVAAFVKRHRRVADPNVKVIRAALQLT